MNDEKYQHVIKLLKSAPRIIAKNDFEKRLSSKLKHKATDNRSQIKDRIPAGDIAINFYANIRSYLVPASGVIALILISVLVYYSYFATDDQYVIEDLTTKSKQEKSLQANDSLAGQKSQEILSYNETTIKNQSNKVDIDTYKDYRMTNKEESSTNVTDKPTGPSFMTIPETHPIKTDEAIPEYRGKLSSEEKLSEDNNVSDSTKLLPATALRDNKKSRRDTNENKINTVDSLEIKDRQNREK